MKIAFIAPYEELTDLVIEVSREIGIKVDAYTGSFETAAQIARRLEDQGYDILISRGATYQHIRESVKIPIIRCETTSFDILYALYDSLQYLKDKRKIGLILPLNHGLEVNKISNILDIELIYMASYSHIEETKLMVNEAINKGAEVIIGGISTVQYTESLGKRGFLLKTSRETVVQAINTALEVYDLTRQQMMETERLNHILKFSYEGIIVADTNGIVTFFNPTAERIFNIDAEEIVGKRADEYIPTTKLLEVVETGQPQLSQIQTVNKNTIITNRIPIKVKDKVEGVVATLPIGYADGFSRVLSGRAYVSINHKRVPVVGTICMDQLMVDVTDIENIGIDDEAILFGYGHESYPRVEDIAKELGTINYELICMISIRVPRIYINMSGLIDIEEISTK
jgi:PAS domain-containing protein